MEKEGKGIPGRTDSAGKGRDVCLREPCSGRRIWGRSRLPGPTPKPGLVSWGRQDCTGG